MKSYIDFFFPWIWLTYPIWFGLILAVWWNLPESARPPDTASRVISIIATLLLSATAIVLTPFIPFIALAAIPAYGTFWGVNWCIKNIRLKVKND